jgi:outer membrane immunogenic protein
MNRTLTVGIGALALAGMTIPTLAADIPRRPPPPPVVAPPVVYNWSGFYIGGHLGGKWHDHDGDITFDQVLGFTPIGLGVFGTGGNDREGAFIGGGQIGFNWQAGGWVFGVEGDFSATSAERTFVCCGPVAAAVLIPPFALGDTITVSNDWQASVRGRLGFAWDRFLVYGTGGVAFANIEATVGLVPGGAFPGFFGTADDTLTGWTAGGGIEFGLWDNWSLGVEYRFTSFDAGDLSLGNVPLILVPGAPLRGNFELETHEVTARLNYRFSWGAPLGPRF